MIGQLSGRDVNGYHKIVVAHFLKFIQRQAAVLNHFIPQLKNEIALFSNGNKTFRGYTTKLGMVPAGQGFCTVNCTFAHVHQWLKKHVNFMATQGMFHIAFQLKLFP